jgi:hypothetical protein
MLYFISLQPPVTDALRHVSFSRGLFYDALDLTGWLMTDDFGRIWEEAVVA